MKKYNIGLMNEKEVNELLVEKINECRDVINSFLYTHSRYDKGDIENCCYEAIYKAIINFDDEKNSSFKSYAKLWIQSELSYFRASELSIPENKESHRKRVKVLNYVNDNNSFDISDDDLEDLKITRSEFDNYKFSLSVESLDKKMTDDGFTLADVVPSEERKELHLFKYLDTLVSMGKLKPEEYHLLNEIFLNKKTEAELSRTLNIARQAVNKRKKTILNKLHTIISADFGSANDVRSALTY